MLHESTLWWRLISVAAHENDRLRRTAVTVWNRKDCSRQVVLLRLQGKRVVFKSGHQG